MRSQVGVGLRVPVAVIHAIQNSVQSRRARAQRSIEAKAVFLGLDLCGITGAYGAERIAKVDAALYEADLAEKFEPVDVEDAAVETDLRKHGGWKQSLIPEVMDSEQGFHPDEGRIVGKHGAQVHGDQAGLPVVTMQDARAEDAARDGQRCA